MARVLNILSERPMWLPAPTGAAPAPIPRYYNGCNIARQNASSPSSSSSSSSSSSRSSGGWGGFADNQPCQQNMLLFPFNPSLEEELNRLFTNFLVSHTPAVHQQYDFTDDDVWEEFRHNGRDYEYCPDPEGPIVPTHSKKRNKKPLPSECVFCKNNGEDVKIYKKHLLKDADGRILCPILRNYTCPICGANGDEAHTIKYCPKNKQTHLSGSVHTFKALRNSTGRRRSK